MNKSQHYQAAAAGPLNKALNCQLYNKVKGKMLWIIASVKCCKYKCKNVHGALQGTRVRSMVYSCCHVHHGHFPQTTRGNPRWQFLMSFFVLFLTSCVCAHLFCDTFLKSIDSRSPHGHDQDSKCLPKTNEEKVWRVNSVFPIDHTIDFISTHPSCVH